MEKPVAADVPAKVCHGNFKKERISMSVVTPNRSEMKHYGGWGDNITKGVVTISGQCISSTC